MYVYTFVCICMYRHTAMYGKCVCIMRVISMYVCAMFDEFEISYDKGNEVNMRDMCSCSDTFISYFKVCASLCQQYTEDRSYVHMR